MYASGLLTRAPPSPANGASEAAPRQKPLLLRLLAGFFARLAASSGTNCEMAEAAGRIEGMALPGEGRGSRRPPGPPAGPAPPASSGALSIASAPPQERRGPRLLSLGRVAPVAAARLAQDAIATTPPACPSVAPVAAAGKLGLQQGLCTGEWINNITIYDRLRVPQVAAGEYVLGFRYDCESSAQVWQQCADVVIG